MTSVIWRHIPLNVTNSRMWYSANPSPHRSGSEPWIESTIEINLPHLTNGYLDVARDDTTLQSATAMLTYIHPHVP
jgi:hypothetical protein